MKNNVLINIIISTLFFISIAVSGNIFYLNNILNSITISIAISYSISLWSVYFMCYLVIRNFSSNIVHESTVLSVLLRLYITPKLHFFIL